MDIGKESPPYYVDQSGTRVLAVSVKDTDGEWKTLKVLELRIGQPIMLAEHSGQLTISAKTI